jgi:TPR repeat protein
VSESGIFDILGSNPTGVRRAFALYSVAAEKGVGAAMQALAGMYRDGRGVARDDALAAEWFARAREA